MPPPDLHDLSYAEMKALVAGLLGRVAELTRTVAELREENVRLKGLKGPDIKPSALSGMERASQGKPLSQSRAEAAATRRRKGSFTRQESSKRRFRAAASASTTGRGHI
jgi:hypothetical protein